MSLILNIETSTDICSIAIAKDGQIIGLAESREAYSHAATINLLVQDALHKADEKLQNLDAIAVSEGPGSYTALRIGVSTAKGFCYALDIPLISISALRALANGALKNMGNKSICYCPMIDARRMEVYTALYGHELSTLIEPQAMIVDHESFNKVFEQYGKVLFCGNGSQKCADIFDPGFAKFTTINSSAQHMVELAQIKWQNQDFKDLAYFVPQYIKAPNITASKKRL